jgi:hypothetical protein
MYIGNVDHMVLSFICIESDMSEHGGHVHGCSRFEAWPACGGAGPPCYKDLSVHVTRSISTLEAPILCSASCIGNPGIALRLATTEGSAKTVDTR